MHLSPMWSAMIVLAYLFYCTEVRLKIHSFIHVNGNICRITFIRSTLLNIIILSKSTFNRNMNVKLSFINNLVYLYYILLYHIFKNSLILFMNTYLSLYHILLYIF